MPSPLRAVPSRLGHPLQRSMDEAFIYILEKTGGGEKIIHIFMKIRYILVSARIVQKTARGSSAI